MGMGRYLVLSLALTLLATTSAAAQGDDEEMEGCYIDGQRGIVDCRQNSQGSQDKDDGFWTGPVAQTIYALLGLGASGGAFFFGWNRVRQRRRTMHQLLSDIETTYLTAKDEPQAGIEHLAGIRAEIKIRHENGRLGDSQYLALEGKVADYTTKLRILALENAFPRLPAELLAEVRNVLADSHLSNQDVARIENRAAALRVPATTRRLLAEHLNKWAAADAPRLPVAPPMAEITFESA
jgi:hypothetical protein